MPSVRSSYSKRKTDDLSIESIELFRNETSKNHFTSDYETSNLILRRGFSFKVLITLSRDLHTDEKFMFELRMGMTLLFISNIQGV